MVKKYYWKYIATSTNFFFALNFKIKLTVECPQEQNLKRISQKTENFNFDHIKNRKFQLWPHKKCQLADFLKNIVVKILPAFVLMQLFLHHVICSHNSQKNISKVSFFFVKNPIFLQIFDLNIWKEIHFFSNLEDFFRQNRPYNFSVKIEPRIFTPKTIDS